MEDTPRHWNLPPAPAPGQPRWPRKEQGPPFQGAPPRAHAGPGPRCSDALPCVPDQTAEQTAERKLKRAPVLCPHSFVIRRCSKAGRTAGSRRPALLELEVWWERQTASKGEKKQACPACGTGKAQGPERSTRGGVLAGARGRELLPGFSPCRVCCLRNRVLPTTRPSTEARQAAATPESPRAPHPSPASEEAIRETSGGIVKS